MKKYRITAIAICLLLTCTQVCAQNSNQKKSNFFITGGYGLAGSFFVRSYHESLPFPSSRYSAFYKKNFIGISNELILGIHTKKNIDIKVGYQYQRFTRHIAFDDTFSDLDVVLDHKIYHINNIWFGGINKNYTRKTRIFSWGTGLYYLRPQQQEVEISPSLIINRERNQKSSRLNELGSYAELLYEYKFQPKVVVGAKGQFFYTLSAGYAESVTLIPFIKIKF